MFFYGDAITQAEAGQEVVLSFGEMLRFIASFGPNLWKKFTKFDDQRYSRKLNNTNLGIFTMASISGIELENSGENKGSL